MTDRRPPRDLQDKPLPEWTRKDREKHEPAGKVWDRDARKWVQG